MKLVDDWRKCWKWLSVQSMAVSSAVLASWQALPESLQRIVTKENVMIGASIVLILGIIGRVVDQNKE